MKKQSVITLCVGLLVGLCIGAGVAMRISTKYYDKLVTDQYVTSVMGDTFVASALRDGKPDVALHHIETNLPNNALMLSTQFRGHPMSGKALAQIKTYYRKNNIPLPDSAKSLPSSGG